ncbi:Carbohydrate sulfotransferase 11 [Eumeta japonica]|uniref:Carbohydrate sulfotransferase n=1 Tax=Eumeta variegata TaxID=151549 RepID=A0A4C1Z4H5_EUMVA|nr:Carbohydrate sulfotransferase 11 [Eumeta japonica]
MRWRCDICVVCVESLGKTVVKTVMSESACGLKEDVVTRTERGKYETLLDDSALALHTVGAPQLQFPRLARASRTTDYLKNYFSQLPLPLIRKLYKKYQLDYRVFDYDLENIVGFDLG